MMAINCTIQFFFSDVFTDPASMREFREGSSDPDLVSPGFARLTDLGGRAYRVTGRWSTRFEARILRDVYKDDA